MDIRVGMIFRSNTNGRQIKILEVNNEIVKYQDLKYSIVFTWSRKKFETFDISEVTQN